MIRLRQLTSEELSRAAYKGWPLVIPMHPVGEPTEVRYFVLEETCGEDSAEGESFKPVEVSLS